MSSQDAYPEPPQPPDLKRRIELYPYQYIAIPILFVIPILALLGMFGETTAVVDERSDDIVVQVEYASRIHHQVFASMIVSVTNQTEAPIETLNVHIEREYLSHFSQITFAPSAETITAEDYIIELQDLDPGNTQVVTVDLRADKPGRHTGTVIVEGDNIAPVIVSLDSILFP